MSDRERDKGRKFSAMCVIALALCGGASVMVTGPMRDRLSAARAELEQVQSVAARSGELLAGSPLVQRESARVEEEIQSIAGLAGTSGGAGSDPTALMSRMSELARGAGVEVNRVSPKLLDVEKTASGVLKPREIIATTVQATGNFQAVSLFLGLLESQPMLGGVQSVRMTPVLTPKGPELSATIEMLHASFAAPDENQMAAILLASQGATPTEKN